MLPRTDLLAAVTDQRDSKQDLSLATVLLQALASGHVGVCLCDERDHIRYCNAAFESAIFDHLPDGPIEFADALAAAIRTGKGIRLDSMPLEAFVPYVKSRRRTGSPRSDFTVDLADGSWWRINEQRLENGWILVVASDISNVKAEEFRLRDEHALAVKAAQTDFLTGLPNRRRGMERAEIAFSEFQLNRLPLTIGLIDIDHFKLINDAHGHDIGDAVLVQFARSLLAYLGPQDQVSRIGGEEFLVVMPETPRSRAESRLQNLMRQMEPVVQDDLHQPLRFSFSAGVAAAVASESLKTALGRADAALYLAKSKGRQRIEIDRMKTPTAA